MKENQVLTSHMIAERRAARKAARAAASKATTKKNRWGRRLMLVLLVLFVIINGAGLFVGNYVYEEANRRTVAYRTQDAARLEASLASQTNREGWQDVTITSPGGYPLAATFIPNQSGSSKTVIFVHGLGQSRATGLYYANIYLRDGFNVLLVDARAHGDSGGDSVTWGNSEKYDLDSWVQWVRQHYPNGEIGIHGVSMGAATALMHAELNETSKQVSFYIADSSYSDFETLLRTQIAEHIQSPPLQVLTKTLLPYVNIVAYLHTRHTFYEASPLHAVRKVTTPILYLHGESDKLIPVTMAEDLQQATEGPSRLYLFPNTDHVGGIFNNPRRYSRVVRDFIQSVEDHQI